MFELGIRNIYVFLRIWMWWFQIWSQNRGFPRLTFFKNRILYQETWKPEKKIIWNLSTGFQDFPVIKQYFKKFGQGNPYFDFDFGLSTSNTQVFSHAEFKHVFLVVLYYIFCYYYFRNKECIYNYNRNSYNEIPETICNLLIFLYSLRWYFSLLKIFINYYSLLLFFKLYDPYH